MNKTKLISLGVLFLILSATLSAQNPQVAVAYVNTTDLLSAFPAKEEVIADEGQMVYLLGTMATDA